MSDIANRKKGGAPMLSAAPVRTPRAAFVEVSSDGRDRELELQARLLDCRPMSRRGLEHTKTPGLLLVDSAETRMELNFRAHY